MKRKRRLLKTWRTHAMLWRKLFRSFISKGRTVQPGQSYRMRNFSALCSSPRRITAPKCSVRHHLLYSGFAAFADRHKAWENTRHRVRPMKMRPDAVAALGRSHTVRNSTQKPGGRRRLPDAAELIENLFGTGAAEDAEPVNDEALEMLKAGAALVYDRQLVSQQLAVTYTIRAKIARNTKGNLTIERKDTSSSKLEV